MLTFSAVVIVLFGAGIIQARPDICGRQPCHPPLKCRQYPGGLSVCVRDPPPTCAATSCVAGQECALIAVNCLRLPCNPKPYCVRRNPCGSCFAPNEFCNLLPRPTCRLVVEPTCENKICAPGEKCVEEPLVCFRAPCGTNVVCRPK